MSDQNENASQELELAAARDRGDQSEDQATAIAEELTKARKAADMAFKARQAAESAKREAEHKLMIAEAAEQRINEALARMNKIENFMVNALASGVDDPELAEGDSEGDAAGEPGSDGAAGSSGAVGGEGDDGRAGADGAHGGDVSPGGAAGSYAEPGSSAGASAAPPAAQAQPDTNTAALMGLLSSMAPLQGRPADEIMSAMGQLSSLLIGTSPAFASAMRAQTDAVATGMAGLNSVSNQQSHFTLDLAATARAVAETYADRSIPQPPPAPAPLPPAEG